MKDYWKARSEIEIGSKFKNNQVELFLGFQSSFGGIIQQKGLQINLDWRSNKVN